MGGSSGGGGSSGAVDYPGYLKTYHEQFLGSKTYDLGAMVALGVTENPYVTALSFDPSAAITEIKAEALDLRQAIQQLGSDDTGRWIDIFTQVSEAVKQVVEELDLLDFDSTEAVKAYDDQLTAILESTTLPKFRAGMRNIGAVQSSAFAMGEAVLIASKDREVAKYAAEIGYRSFDSKSRVMAELAKAGVSDILTHTAKRIEQQQNAVHYGMEARRLEIVSQKERIEKEVEYDVHCALWSLELSEYLNHGIASIAGAATTSTGGKKSNPMQSAIGGALVGAGAGAMMGGVPGAAIGAAVGLGAGLMMG